MAHELCQMCMYVCMYVQYECILLLLKSVLKSENKERKIDCCVILKTRNLFMYVVICLYGYLYCTEQTGSAAAHGPCGSHLCNSMYHRVSNKYFFSLFKIGLGIVPNHICVHSDRSFTHKHMYLHYP